MKTIDPSGKHIINYEVAGVQRETAIYQWLEARDLDTQQPVTLQLPQPHLSQAEINAIFDYFDNLQFLKSRSGFIVPEVQGDRDYPLVLVYSHYPQTSLREALKRSPENAKVWWTEAAFELLHGLHNKGLTHGNLTAGSFVLDGDRLCLTDFGYSPLLNFKNNKAISDCQANFAPEVSETGTSIAADIYAFARAISSCHPHIKQTVWYRRSTHSEPEKRFSKMREAAERLTSIFDGNGIN